MLKYLDKIKVVSETAGNGEECTELVFSKEPGYYSLIIVSNSLFLTILMHTLLTLVSVRHSNARQKWLRHLSGDPRVGTKEPLPPDSDNGALCECYDGSDR